MKRKSNKKQTSRKEVKKGSLDALRAKWYKKLKKEGFEDIESTFNSDYTKYRKQVGLTMRGAKRLPSFAEKTLGANTTHVAEVALKFFQAWTTYATHHEHVLSKKEYEIMWQYGEGLGAKTIAKNLKSKNYSKPRSEWAVFYYIKNKWAEVKEWNTLHIDGVYNEGYSSVFELAMEVEKENLFARPETLKAKRGEIKDIANQVIEENFELLKKLKDKK